jgi:hypothetical protein
MTSGAGAAWADVTMLTIYAVCYGGRQAPVIEVQTVAVMTVGGRA